MKRLVQFSRESIALLFLDKGMVFTIQFVAAVIVYFISNKFINVEQSKDIGVVLAKSSPYIIGLILFQILNQAAIIARLYSIQTGINLTLFASYTVAFKRAPLFALAHFFTLLFISIVLVIPATILSVIFGDQNIVTLSILAILMFCYVFFNIFLGILIIVENKSPIEAVRENYYLVKNNLSIKIICLICLLYFLPYIVLSILKIESPIVAAFITSSFMLFLVGLKTAMYYSLVNNHQSIDNDKVFIV